MDSRTTIRELDELIKRTQSAIEHDQAILKASPEAGLRDEKQQQIGAMRIQLRRLRTKRKAIKVNRREGHGAG